MGKAPDNKKKKCLTVIPTTWPQFTGPEYKNGMSVEEAQKLWFGYLRVMKRVGVNPKVPRGKA